MMPVYLRQLHDVSANPPFGRVGLAVRRWRNVRGFGVHSPAAFALMREVVRPDRKYGLYSYYPLDCLLERASISSSELYPLRSLMRMLLRLSCHLSPAFIRISLPSAGGGISSLAPIFTCLPALAGVPEQSRNASGSGLWIFGSRVSEGEIPEIESALQEGCALVLIGEAGSEWSRFYSRMPGGVRIMMPGLSLLLPIPGSACSTYHARLHPSR